MTLTVYLADDHTLVRRGMRRLFEQGDEFEVVGEAPDGITAIREIVELCPDIAVLDLTMPGMAGIEVTEEIRRQELGTRILLCTMHQGESILRRVIESGASGYVLKDDSPEVLLDAVRALGRGDRYFSPSLGNVLYSQLMGETREAGGFSSLTARERQVLKLFADGMTHREIGRALSISAKTVESHKASLARKLNCRSTVDLIKIAIREQLTDL